MLGDLVSPTSHVFALMIVAEFSHSEECARTQMQRVFQRQQAIMLASVSRRQTGNAETRAISSVPSVHPELAMDVRFTNRLGLVKGMAHYDLDIVAREVVLAYYARRQWGGFTHPPTCWLH